MEDWKRTFHLETQKIQTQDRYPPTSLFIFKRLSFGVRCLPTELKSRVLHGQTDFRLLHPLKSLSYSMEVPGGATPLLSLLRTCTGITD